MNSSVVFGVLFGAAIGVLVFMVARRLRRMKRYARVVKAHLGANAVWVYNEIIMIHCYDHNLDARDAAREMQASRRSPHGH